MISLISPNGKEYNLHCGCTDTWVQGGDSQHVCFPPWANIPVCPRCGYEPWADEFTVRLILNKMYGRGAK